MPARRWLAVAAMLATMALGLASRRGSHASTPLLGKYPGDALWALMVLFAWRAGQPRATTSRVGLAAGATCVAVEFAKLWQAPWLVQFRHTTLGHLLLGHAFSWQNLVAYAVGVIVGIGFDRLLFPTPR